MLSEQLQLFRLPSPPAAAKTRHLLISGRIIDYRLKSGAKRLTMTIDERGLRIGAPQRISLIEIEAFVHEHGEWVLKKLAELAHATQPRHVAVRDGTRLPLLDGEAEVRVMPGANRVRWIGDQLLLEARAEADLGQLAMRALQKRALAHFGERLARYCRLLGLPTPTYLHLPVAVNPAGEKLSKQTEAAAAGREAMASALAFLGHEPPAGLRSAPAKELGDREEAFGAAHGLTRGGGGE